MLHTTLGTNYSGAYDTLKIRHLSYHFIIDEDGTIYQLVPLERSAWHAGVKSHPNLRVRTFFGSDNPNRRSIGIAFVRYGDTELTPEQRDAGVWLTKEIGKRTGVRYNADNIFYHQEVTDYKPREVGRYREQILEGLVGFRDDIDAGEMSDLQLRIKQLMQIIALLQTLLSLKQKNK